jgi:DNA-binding CsgD family transcriptional regulator
MSEVNQAAKLLVLKVAEQKKELQESMGHNLGITVYPLLDHLKTMNLTEAQLHVVETLDFNLRHIAACFGADFIDRKLRLSAREIEVCRMIRSGKDSGQIAEAFGLARQTIVVHRKNIRRKLGLKKNKQNLAAYLKEHL